MKQAGKEGTREESLGRVGCSGAIHSALRTAKEGEMVGWICRLNGHECEQTLGDSEGQGSLACCSPWDRQESDTTEQLNKSALRTVKEMRLGTCGIGKGQGWQWCLGDDQHICDSCPQEGGPS